MQIYSLLNLTRPVNVLIAWAATFVVMWILKNQNPFLNFWQTLPVPLICAGGNVLNDYFDIEIDKINKPNRPLPSGKIPKNLALSFSVLLLISGVLIAFQFSTQLFVISIFAASLISVYDWNLKRLPLVGNFVVSLVSGMTFLYAGAIVLNIREALVPALLGFFFHFAREILKDIEDIKGDKKEDAKTFPIQFGILNSKILVTLIIIVLITLTIIAFFTENYSWLYLITVIFTVDLGLVFVLLSAWKNHGPENLNKLNKLLKIEMLFGLLSLALK